MNKQSQIIKISEILEELQNDLSNDEINKEFNKVISTTERLVEKKNQVQQNAQNQLQLLKEKCEDIEERAFESQDSIKRKYNKQLKNLKEKKRIEEGKLNNESYVLEEITNKMSSIKLDQKVLAEKEVKLKHKQNVDIERDRTTFKLLSNTLKIKWDYTCTNEKVQGFVSGKSPVPFSANKQDDRFETVNYLWDLIELSDQ